MVPTTDTVWRYLRAPSSVYGPLIGVGGIALAAVFFPLAAGVSRTLLPQGASIACWATHLGSAHSSFRSRSSLPPGASLSQRRPNAAARRSLIAALAKGDAARARPAPRLRGRKAGCAEASSQFVRGCGRFPLTAVGDVNTYALFAEAFLRLPSMQGRAGLIVPTGIATDDSTKAFFENVTRTHRLVSLLSFENEEFVFPAVHHAYRFALMTLAGSAQNTAATLVFFARRYEHLADERRQFRLSAQDIDLLNPKYPHLPSISVFGRCGNDQAYLRSRPSTNRRSKRDCGEPVGR